LLVAINNTWAAGLQGEATVAVSNSPGRPLRSLPFGGRVNWGPADWLTVGLFLGVETQRAAQSPEGNWLAARATVTLAW